MAIAQSRQGAPGGRVVSSIAAIVGLQGRIMKSRYVKSLAIAALGIAGILPVIAQTQLVDLGVATGYAINNAGQVVLSTGIYSNGTVAPLPALPGQTTPAVGVAINASGQVAGNAVA